MSLKITLKPYEKFIIGGAVIINGEAKSTFVVENDVPILRQKDISGSSSRMWRRRHPAKSRCYKKSASTYSIIAITRRSS